MKIQADIYLTNVDDGIPGAPGAAGTAYRLVRTNITSASVTATGDTGSSTFKLQYTLQYKVAKKVGEAAETNVAISQVSYTIGGTTTTMTPVKQDSTGWHDSTGEAWWSTDKTVWGIGPKTGTDSYTADSLPPNVIGVTVMTADGVTLQDAVPVTLQAGVAINIDTKMGELQSTVAGHTGSISTLTQNSEEISMEVANYEKSNDDAVSKLDSRITQTAKDITATVSSRIAGRNLIYNSRLNGSNGDSKLPDKWETWQSGTVTKTEGNEFDYYECVKASTSSSEGVGLRQEVTKRHTGTLPTDPIEGGAKYIYSVWAKAKSASSGNKLHSIIHWRKYLADGSQKIVSGPSLSGTLTTEWQRFVVVLDAPSDATFFVPMIGYYGTDAVDIFVSRPKLEKVEKDNDGNYPPDGKIVPSAWSPTDDLNSAKEDSEAAIKVASDSITASVTKGLSETGISIEDKRIRLKSDNVEVKNNSGETTFSVDADGNIVGKGDAHFSGNITGSKITGSTLESTSGNYTTTITGGNITTNYVTATGGKIGGWTIDNNGLSAAYGSPAYISLSGSTSYFKLGGSSDYLLSMRNDRGGAISIECYTGAKPAITVLHNASSTKNNVAIETYGSNHFYSRSGESTIINRLSFGSVVSSATTIYMDSCYTPPEGTTSGYPSNVIICTNNSSPQTVYFPKEPVLGQFLIIFQDTTKKITFNGNGHKFRQGTAISPGQTANSDKDGQWNFFLYDGQYWQCVYVQSGNLW